MVEKKRKVGVHIRCDPELRRKFKVFCASKDMDFERALEYLIELAERHEKKADVAVVK
jgi:hypothetical protein